MKDKTIVISILIVILVFLGFQQYMVWKYPAVTDNQILIEKINNLETKIDSLSNKKDSIHTIVVEIEKTIDKNNKNYEKVVSTILTNDDSTNLIWAKQYIEKYRLEHSK